MTGNEQLKADPRSTAELIDAALTRDEESHDGWRAATVLHGRGTREVLDAAMALCRSPDAHRRACGALILGQLGVPDRTFPKQCCEALLDLTRHDDSEYVVGEAVFALGHLGNPCAEPDLINLRHHPAPAIRHGVAFALCGATSTPAVAALLELMEDPHDLARDWATTGIGGTVSIDGPEIREALLRRANDVDEITRAEALHGLARRHDERVAPYLRTELQAVGSAPTFLPMPRRPISASRTIGKFRSKTCSRRWRDHPCCNVEHRFGLRRGLPLAKMRLQ